MNIDTTALDALFDANPDTAKGIAAAYQVLLGGVPTQAGFTFLINNAAMTNFGAGPGSMFNAENIYINLANSLVLGNPTAAANFASISTGATLADKITSLYNTLIPLEDRTSEGLAYLIRTEALDFYRSVATERGMTGDAGAAIVAMASILQIAVRMDIGVGADVNDLIAAVNDGSSQLPAMGEALTDIDVADGPNFDPVVPPTPVPTPPAPTSFTANKVGFSTGNTSDSNEAIVTGSADNTIIAPDNFLTGATVNGAGGNDTLLVTTTATVGGLGAVAGGTITEVDIINLQAGGVVDLANVDTDLNTINASAASTVTTDANNADVILNGSGGVDTLVIGGTDFTGTFAGGGGTDVISSAGGDINNATIAADVETLMLLPGGPATLTAAQHNAFATIVGGNLDLMFSDAFIGTGNATVGSYFLANTNNNFTVGSASQSVAVTGGVNTVNFGGFTSTGTLGSFDLDDTVVVTTGGNISSVNFGAALGAGILDLTGDAITTFNQHDGFTTINAASPGDQITIAAGQNIGTITTDADVEVYSVGDSTDTTAVIIVSGATQQVSATSNSDAVTFNLGVLAFTGTITGEGAVDDTLQLSAGANISGGTINGVELLTTMGGGNFTFTNAQITGFTSVTATGIETAVITDAATIIVDDDGVLQRGDFENFTLSNNANDITFEMEFDDTIINSVTLGTAVDVVRLFNDRIVFENTSNDHVVITGYTAGNDMLDVEIGGANVTSTNSFESVDAGSDTPVTGDDGGNGVIEIVGGNTVSTVTALDTSAAGFVTQVIDAAVGTLANAGGDEYAVILYGDDNAYVYTMLANSLDGGNVGVINIQVELVAQVNDVALGALDAADFI